MTSALTSATFDEQIGASEKTVLVDFWAEWCGPCKQMNPVLEELAGEFEGQLEVYKVDVDTNPDLAQRFGVMSIPSFVLLCDGREVSRVVGARPISAMRDLVKSQL